MDKIDYGIAVRSLELECGDMPLVLNDEEQYLLVLLDVLGHGGEAGELAQRAKKYIEEYKSLQLEQLISGVDDVLRDTRGAVGAFIRLDVATGIFEYESIGNVTMRIIGADSSVFVPSGGVIGYSMPKLKEKRSCLQSGDIFLMYSDGMRDGFSSYEWADLWLQSAQDIAQGLLERFCIGDDDASVIVLKYGTFFP